MYYIYIYIYVLTLSPHIWLLDMTGQVSYQPVPNGYVPRSWAMKSTQYVPITQEKTMEQLTNHQINRPLFANHIISVFLLVANTSGKVHLITNQPVYPYVSMAHLWFFTFLFWGLLYVYIYIQYSPISHHIISHHDISCNWDLLYISGVTIYIYI